MSAFFDISAAFNIAWDNAALGIETAYENASFKPTDGQPWAQLNMIPAAVSNETAGVAGIDEHTGVFSIQLNYPINNGASSALILADGIRSYFYGGRRLVSNNQSIMVRYTNIDQGRIVGDSYRLTASITWSASVLRR